MLSRKLAFLAGAAAVAYSASASAHFDLISPPSIARATEKIGKGDPPCGPDTANPATPSMSVKAGDMLAITINETTPHPGWYRVSLAKSARTELPKDPTPTASGGLQCGTVTGNQIVGLAPDPNPAMPVLADGALHHTAPLNGMQTFMVKIPADVSCTNCILEVEEFMSMHNFNGAAGCFYHHCASIAVTGGTTGDAGTSSDAASDKPADGGSAGTAGAAGTTGSAGATGSAGITGSAGTVGSAGATGSAGMTGSAGSAGTSGTMGSAGTTGSGGSTGGGTAGSNPPRSGAGGCTVGGSSGSGSGAAMLLLGCLALARRRRERISAGHRNDFV